MTLLVDAGRLVLETRPGSRSRSMTWTMGRVGGVDLGIIHPIAAQGLEHGTVGLGGGGTRRRAPASRRPKARQHRMTPKEAQAKAAGLATLAKAARSTASRRGDEPAPGPPSAPRSRPELSWTGPSISGSGLWWWVTRTASPTGCGGDAHGRRHAWRRTHLMGAITDKADPRRHHRRACRRTRVPRAPAPPATAASRNPRDATSCARTVDTTGIATSLPPATSPLARGGTITTIRVVVEHRRVGPRPSDVTAAATI